MNKTKFLTLAVIVLALLNVGVILFFTSGRKMPPPPQDGPQKIIIERLNFDEAQVADYEKLIKEHQLAINEKMKEVGDAQKVLFEYLQNENFTKKDSLTNIIGNLNQEINNIHFEHFKELKKLCKPEQLGEFNTLTSDIGKFLSPPKKGNKKHKPPKE